MFFALFNIIIFVIEAAIAYQYIDALFIKKNKLRFEWGVWILAYSCLFFLSLFHMVWVNIFSFFIVNVLLIRCLFTAKWNHALFHSFILTAVMLLGELIMIAIHSRAVAAFQNTQKYDMETIFTATLSKLIYFIICRLFIMIHGSLKEDEKIEKNSLALYFVPITTIGIYYVLLIICFQYPLSKTIEYALSFCNVSLLAINVIVFWEYSRIQKNNRERMDLMIQVQRESDTAEYYRLLMKQDEEQRIIIHDIKKHLQSVVALNRNGGTEDVENYVGKLLDQLNISSAHFCQNEMLNILLNRYHVICSEKKILFSADVRKNTLRNVDRDDLTSLFGNLLDNAVEAAENTEDAFIDVRISNAENNNITLIAVVNSCSTDPFADNDLLRTKKQDKFRHGYGLKSIRAVVKKYRGNMKLYYKTGEFHAVIYLHNE